MQAVIGLFRRKFHLDKTENRFDMDDLSPWRLDGISVVIHAAENFAVDSLAIFISDGYSIHRGDEGKVVDYLPDLRSIHNPQRVSQSASRLLAELLDLTFKILMLRCILLVIKECAYSGLEKNCGNQQDDNDTGGK